jgi:dCMP deaminase
LAEPQKKVQGRAGGGGKINMVGEKNMSGKRTDYLSWDEYFMAVALLAGRRSKDPSTQVGACVANTDNKIIGVGYNGFPWGCSDDDLPWNRDGKYLDTKYPYVCHAELNAVLNSTSRNLSGCRIYVALFPCNECTKVIIQSGIREIVYLSDKYKDTDSVRASKIMLGKSGVIYRRFKPERDAVRISFTSQIEEK